MALTRVREGSKVFLKSFDTSYIVANEKIKEKIDAMRKFDSYKMKKIYVDERIFENEEEEIKLGYLNINGLLDGNHAEYLNKDRNLLNIDLLVLAETKLNSSMKTSNISNIFTNWDILERHDSNDKLKHMGLLMVTPKKFTGKIKEPFKVLEYQSIKRNNQLQIQFIMVKVMPSINAGFIYCRTTPSDSEVKKIIKISNDCSALLGDLNLSPRNEFDLKKIKEICQKKKSLALKEVTRCTSNNQVDHILVNDKLLKMTYATSFFNFISDHKSIVLRIGSQHNKIRGEILEKVANEALSKIELKNNQNKVNADNVPESYKESNKEEPKQLISFRRRIRNPDMASCWLNSCLQLILTALDYCRNDIEFNSDLGTELLSLQRKRSKQILNPTRVKQLLVEADEMRNVLRKSEVMGETQNLAELSKKLRNIDELRLNLITGQQCVRDFFVCLSENIENWPDVYEKFCFGLQNSF